MITLSFIAVAGVGVINQLTASEEIIREERKHLCRKSLQEFAELLELRGKILALKRKDWVYIYGGIKPFYRELSARDLIDEVVVSAKVAPPQKRNNPPWDITVSGNGVWIRSLSPVFDGGFPVGEVSVGVSMKDFLNEYSRITESRCGIALREDLLRKLLSPDEFNSFMEERFWG